MITSVQICYGAKVNLHNGRKLEEEIILVLKFLLSKKALIVSNFCLIGKIPHVFPILRNIESAQKTFIGIQVRVNLE